MSDPRVLVVDDDADLRTLIGDYLASNGMSVALAGDAKAMDAALGAGKFDLIVLDLMMPGEDGLSVLRRMQRSERPAIIMLSAMGDDNDRIIGLEVGADDYLAKPCNPRELLARVRAVLRRREGRAAGSVRSFGVWALDQFAREIARVGCPPASLTDAEFRILNAFLDRPQRVLTRDQLIDFGKGSDSDVYDRAIDVTISRLRKKLGEGDPIRTVRGEGYMFTLKASGA
jgi:two-component system, OmpR family, response regulator